MKKILIPILQKNGIKSSRFINKHNKKYYDYNHSKKVYIKKSKIEIAKIKFISISRRKEKKITKRVKKEVKKEKEELIEKKVKVKEKKEEKEEEKLGYELNTYCFTCRVSDRKIKHLYGIRAFEDNMLLDFHEANYPDHTVQKVDFYSSHFVEYGKTSLNNNYITEKQKKYLKKLGYSNDEISLVRSKTEARQMINKRKK